MKYALNALSVAIFCITFALNGYALEATASGTGFRQGTAAETRVRQMEAMMNALANDLNTKVTNLGISLTTVQQDLDKVKFCNDAGKIFDPNGTGADGNGCIGISSGGCEVCVRTHAGGSSHGDSGEQCSPVSTNGNWTQTGWSYSSNSYGGRYAGTYVKIRCH